MKKTVILREPKQAHQVLTDVLWPAVKSWLLCDGGALVVTVKPETRKESQSRRFHKLIGHASDQLGGKLADREDAKRILVSAFRIDTIRDADLAGEWAKFGEVRMGHGLRGEVVMLGIQTREFSSKLGYAFCIWMEAFCVEFGVVIPAEENEQ